MVPTPSALPDEVFPAMVVTAIGARESAVSVMIRIILLELSTMSEKVPF
jgi:hypothetical protein